MRDCCIGTYMARWFATSIPLSPISGISPHIISPQPSHPLLSLPHSPTTDPSVWCFPPCVHVFSMFNTHLWVRTCGLWLSVLCQFAENDGSQIHPCPYKGYELIISYGCIVFHGVYVPHFPCPVYHQWAFGLIPGFCYCKQCRNEHACTCRQSKL